MFSEYASRFLQQSNARLPLNSPDDQRSRSRNPLDRRRGPAANSRYLQRPNMPMHPYNAPSASQSRFPFASRLSRPDPSAPLFYSAADEFQNEDEGDEHERDMADLYALQRSRQHFGRSNLTESSELEDDGIEKLGKNAQGHGHDRDESTRRGRAGAPQSSSRPQSAMATEYPSPDSKGNGRLVDVNLNSTIHEEPPESLTNLSPSIDPDEPPAPFQTFRPTKNSKHSGFMPMETDEASRLANPRPPSTDRESVPQTVILPSQEPPSHDAFWGTIFKITMFAMFAAFVLTWFQTSPPTSKNPLGDTIYSALRMSTSRLLWDTLIAIIVALIWLSLLRNHVRALVFGLIVAVPVVLSAFALYPFISSFQGSIERKSVQDTAMRWLSFVPAIMAAFWTWSVIKNRHSLAHAISILEFSTKILTASPYLVILGFATLAIVVVWSWIWMLMFERVFLAGRMSSSNRFIIDTNSWWLGAYFILEYLWSLGIIAGVQRAATASTVSQWYFHRLAVPQPTSQEVVKASLIHALDPLFGTVCLSTFLSLMVRLPLIILPGRISGILNLCAYWIIPTSLATLTNPLTLTYAAIHSQPLGIAARGLAQLSFISNTNPSNTLNHRNFNPAAGVTSALLPYRLSKLLLQATRWIMSFALGFSGWVGAARNAQIQGVDGGVQGSLYAYIVGFIAGTIGFAVLGAVENEVGAVVDSAVICWASESAGGRGEARFCREAGELFGNDGVASVNHDDRSDIV